MKTLKNHLILFDEECPMCSIYTKAIVGAGFLDKQGRAAYQELSPEVCPMLDRQRAANEIALINKDTGEVTYGIESLFKIFAQIVPFLEPLFKFKPFIWLMSKVYAFISYNRRVIIPPAKGNSFQFQPTFKLRYRIIYLVFTWLFTSYILSAYTGLMVDVIPHGSTYREYLVCGGQIIFQGLIILLVSKKNTWAYLGNMMTISFAGAMLLVPILFVSIWFQLNPTFCLIWFLTVAGLMLLEHIRRVSLLNLGWGLTLTWVLYCVAILL